MTDAERIAALEREVEDMKILIGLILSGQTDLIEIKTIYHESDATH